MYIYRVYSEYQVIEKRVERQKEFNRVNELLKALEKEQFFSIVYLSKQSDYNKKKMHSERLKTNAILEQNSFLLKDELNEVLDYLPLVRQEVDKLNVDYLRLLSNHYHNTIIKPLIDYLERVSDSDTRKNELILIRLRDSINLENSFLAFSLLQSKKMDKKDLHFWETILEERIIPEFIVNGSDKVSVKLDKEHFNKIGFKERIELLLGAKYGEYRLSLNEWLSVVNEKVKKIDEAEKILFFNEKIRLDNQFLRKERQLNKYVVLALLFFILLMFIFYGIHLFRNIIKSINRDKLFLKNTLREIEVEVDEDKRRELEALIQRNDSIEIYKFLANEIKEPSRAKDLFLANMSHEIRTPLNGIVGFTKELQRTELTQEQQEMLDIIEESSNHLIHIVNDILDFSKLKAGKVELESIPFDPIVKFETAIDTFVAKAREKHIELKVYMDPHIPTELEGDPTKIVQVLNNLISNAIKFTVDRGVVEISVTQVAEYLDDVQLKFLVKDSGIGIKESEKKKIFDAFSQADASTNRKYGGTGLGLSISSQFVKHMGGKLEVESKEGVGSSFFFTLKLKKTLNSKERPKKRLTQLKIAYLPPLEEDKVDCYLRSYVEYHEALFLTYTLEEVLSMKQERLPDLLFVDYLSVVDEKELKLLLFLPTKIVLVVSESKEGDLGTLRSKIDNILHKPINYSRTCRALDILIKKEIKRETSTAREKELSFSGKRVLIAEDNLINQKLMKSILNRFDIETEMVENGEEALERLEKHSYDLIFMDIQMPKMGGIEATERILYFEAKKNKKHTPIVALTANALAGDKEKYLNVGMDDYLAKPMRVKELEAILVKFL